MRDFRDSKVMAHALRDALKAKAVDITHSESLELIAATFGFANWNILSAKIEAAGPRANDERQSSPVGAQDLARPKTLHCSFCGKSQHEVRKLIAGPSASYICNECAELCVNISNEEVSFAKIFGPLRPDEGKGDAASVTSLQLARRASSEELEGVLERGKRVVTSQTRALQGIEQRLAMRADEDWRGDELLALPELAYLRDKSREDLLSIQQATRVELERYEEGLRIAATILAERGEQVR